MPEGRKHVKDSPAMTNSLAAAIASSATWDNVRQAQVQIIIEASGRVHETYARCSAAHLEVDRITRQLEAAKSALAAAVADRDEWTEKIHGYVEAYAHIGEGQDPA